MLPSPQTSEDMLAPTLFRPGGAEVLTSRAIEIWRRSQRQRAGIVVMRAAWSVLVGLCLVVGF
jgi:hypothetical protein